MGVRSTDVSLQEFIPDGDTGSVSLVVVSQSQPRPIQSMLEEIFDEQSVTVEQDRGQTGDEVLLVEDGTVRARSPLTKLWNTILFVNSDLYITGAQGIDDLEVPEIVTDLDGVPFSLQGYPESNKQKLLLIVISRYIEQLAWQTEGGTLRASFQQLSRIDDERGTRTVYETVAETDTDVHVYGIPDWCPPRRCEVTMHSGYSEDFRRGWFVVYNPPADGDGGAALVAYETAPRKWDAIWTYDDDRIAEITAYIRREM